MILHGTLLNPVGTPYANASVRLVAVSTSSQVLQSVYSSFKTSGSGAYSFDCPVGRYRVQVSGLLGVRDIGIITVTDQTVIDNINELLMIESTASHPGPILDQIGEVIAGLAEVEEAVTVATSASETAVQAKESADIDAASALDSKNTVISIQSQLPSVSQFNDIESQVNALEMDPMNGVTSWLIPAKEFDLVQGVPTFGAITGRLAAWQFPLDTAAYIATPIALPSHWLTMDVYVQWVNQVANAGNVVWGGEIHQWAIGDTINTTPVGGSGIFSANASPWIATESKVAADIAINPAKNTTLRIARQGASGNDTLPNSAAILAVRLVKKS